MKTFHHQFLSFVGLLIGAGLFIGDSITSETPVQLSVDFGLPSSIGIFHILTIHPGFVKTGICSSKFVVFVSAKGIAKVPIYLSSRNLLPFER